MAAEDRSNRVVGWALGGFFTLAALASLGLPVVAIIE
jgi:hypothetical protein